MAGGALVEVFGSIIFGLTRSVAELFNSNEVGFDPEAFGFNPLESTGLEWNCFPDEELIFEEYGGREVSRGAVQARFLNACLPEGQENIHDQNRAMEWKRFRPLKICTIRDSMYFGFLISMLAATLIGTFCILVYYVSYQVILVCLTRPKESIPAKIQWSKTISECIEIVFIHFWFFANTLFFFRSYQIRELKSKLLLISSVFCVLDTAYRIALQALSISQSLLTPVQRIPGNVLFSLSICMQSWVLARHFSRAVGASKLTTFLWILGSGTFLFIAGIIMAVLIYPAYNKQEKIGKIYTAVFAPLITVVLKGSSRLCVQRLWRISRPGTSFVFLAPLYYASGVMLRVLQVDLTSLKSVALIGIIHGIAEVIERSVVVLSDYIYQQIYERRRLCWESFRTPRRERLATDIVIMSMLCETSAIISVNGFLYLHEYFYTNKKTVLELLQSFAITTAVPLVIEWFFTCLTIAIETRYQNRPIMKVWRRQWKRHLIVAIVNAFAIAIWTSTSLLVAIQGRFSQVKDYCESPFSYR